MLGFAIVATLLHLTLLTLYMSGPAGERARVLWSVQLALGLISSGILLRAMTLSSWQLIVFGTLMFAGVGLLMEGVRRLPHRYP